jgi:hypothetical protein
MSDMAELFYRPLSNHTFQELGELQMIMQNHPLSDQVSRWTYAWGEKYTLTQFYSHIHKHIQVLGVLVIRTCESTLGIWYRRNTTLN